jgi:hypothetical protein
MAKTIEVQAGSIRVPANKLPLLTGGILLAFLLMLGTSCKSIASPSSPAATASKPQSGKWLASLTYPASGGQDVTWALVFTVSEDGKQISSAQASHYLGQLTPDTRATVLMALQPEEIENGSFSISFTEFSGFTTYTRTFEGTFTSSSQATGTLKTGGETYAWTAAPAAP